MFVIRFDFDQPEPFYAGIIGKGTTAGCWGFTAYEDAQTFATVGDAEECLAKHYSAGTAHTKAEIVDSFDEAPAAGP